MKKVYNNLIIINLYVVSSSKKYPNTQTFLLRNTILQEQICSLASDALVVFKTFCSFLNGIFKARRQGTLGKTMHANHIKMPVCFAIAVFCSSVSCTLGYMVGQNSISLCDFPNSHAKISTRKKFQGPSPLGSAWYANGFTTHFRFINSLHK